MNETTTTEVPLSDEEKKLVTEAFKRSMGEECHCRNCRLKRAISTLVVRLVFAMIGVGILHFTLFTMGVPLPGYGQSVLLVVGAYFVHGAIAGRGKG